MNKTLVATLNKLGAKAIGLCGIDGGFLTAKAGSGAPCSGELVKTDGALLEDFLTKGYTPVVATIAQGGGGPRPGVQRQRQSDGLQAGGGPEGGEAHPSGGGGEPAPRPRGPGEPPSRCSPCPRCPPLIRSGTIPADMAAKVNFSVEAVRSGVKSATLLDGRFPTPFCWELLSDEGIGHHADPLKDEVRQDEKDLLKLLT